MAQYDHLPVFKKNYDLLLVVFQSVTNFEKEYKYTIGENLKKETLEIIVIIYQANSRVEKSGMIIQAKEHLELARLYIRISKDLKQIISISLPEGGGAGVGLLI